MSTSTTLRSRLYQRRWYEKQKPYHGTVYLIKLKDGNSYVGYTTNSVDKAIWSKLADLRNQGYNTDDSKTEVVITCDIDNVKQETKETIDLLRPSINLKQKKPVKKPTSRGILFGGIYYLTQYSLWKDEGKTKYGTFKSRLHKYPGQLEYALGLKKNHT